MKDTVQVEVAYSMTFLLQNLNRKYLQPTQPGSKVTWHKVKLLIACIIQVKLCMVGMKASYECSYTIASHNAYTDTYFCIISLKKIESKKKKRSHL